MRDILDWMHDYESEEEGQNEEDEHISSQNEVEEM